MTRPVAPRVVALHGIESTGKSRLAAALAQDLATVCVPEYGREYCLEHGTDCTPADLAIIAETQQRMIAAAKADAGAVVITDTDWLMTRAWHRMMIGSEMQGPAYPVADLYLHLAPDVEWIDDGLRLHAEAEQRRRFDALCRDELVQAGAHWVEIGGDWPARHAAALAAVRTL
jgi:HTH-type transcriptional regulator, transcriptional repressor of NAD biosynthesis genes